jgi:hypothetical protein
MEKIKLIKVIYFKLFNCIWLLFLLPNLHVTSTKAQTNIKFEMKIKGVNKVLLKHTHSYKLNGQIYNYGSKALKLNSSIINSEYFHENGMCWELQTYNNDSFIPYDSIYTFNINDINYVDISENKRYLTINHSYKYEFYPFEVYTPNKTGIYRVRLIYKNCSFPYKYSDWFYIYVYKNKQEWKNLILKKSIYYN